MKKLQKIDFTFELAFNKKLPDFYYQAQNKSGAQLLLSSPSTEFPDLSDMIYMVYDVPSFLNVNLKPLEASTGFTSIIQYKGYCFNFEDYTDIESYVKDRFKSNKSRGKLRSWKKRLETCFDVRYNMYYGNIDRIEYDKLFKRFYKLLEARAIEKGIVNRNLKDWGFYSSRVYDMIINKQASLFVIYDGDKAINMSLNLHVKNTVFLYMAAYDIDYSKFRLGHTNILMLLDWFIKNGIKLVDLSKGNVGYKQQWANVEYDFKYHLFYDSSRFTSNIKALLISSKFRLLHLLISSKFRLLQYLRKKNLNTYYYSTLGWFKGKEKKIQNYKFDVNVNLPEKHSLILIDFLENEKYFFLKRIIYNYLYNSSLNVKKLLVHKDLCSDQVYYFHSPKEIVRVTLKK